MHYIHDFFFKKVFHCQAEDGDKILLNFISNLVSGKEEELDK